MTKPERDAESQAKRFREAARELGCDNDEQRFAEIVRKVARQRPKESEEEKPG